MIHQAFTGFRLGKSFFKPIQENSNPSVETVLLNQVVPERTEGRVEQSKVNERIGKSGCGRSENLPDGQRLKLNAEKHLSLGRLKLYRHGIEAVDKTLCDVILPAADLSKKGEIVVQVKDDFHDTFGYDDFPVKRDAPFNLPNNLNGMAETRCLWYIKTVVQKRVVYTWTQKKAERSRENQLPLAFAECHIILALL